MPNYREGKIIDTFLRDLYREWEGKAVPPSGEDVITFFENNPDLVNRVAALVARYNAELIALKMDSGRAGDIAKAFSGILWGVILQNE